MFEKRATIDPRYSDQAQAIAVNKQLTLPAQAIMIATH